VYLVRVPQESANALFTTPHVYDSFFGLKPMKMEHRSLVKAFKTTVIKMFTLLLCLTYIHPHCNTTNSSTLRSCSLHLCIHDRNYRILILCLSCCKTKQNKNQEQSQLYKTNSNTSNNDTTYLPKSSYIYVPHLKRFLNFDFEIPKYLYLLHELSWIADTESRILKDGAE